MKEYIINKLCKINTENPTPSVEGRDIAINIVPVEKNQEFENFVLAIDNFQQCCEDFGAYNNFIESGYYFVEEIILGVDLTRKELDEFDLGFDGSDDEDYYLAAKIITDEGEFIAIVYNIHNGYYSHCIYYSDNELKLDVLEEAYL